MKRVLIITGWSLLGLFGAIIIALSIACYLIFTPARLTAIAHQVADQYVTCEYELDEAELTYFSTFPYFGVSVKDACLINPMEGAQSDTLVAVPELLVSVKLMDAIHGDIFIKRFHLRDATANIYIAADGTTNFDVFKSEDDEEEEEDEGGWQLKSVGWEEDLKVSARHLSFVDEKDTIAASLDDVTISLASKERDTMEGAQLDLTAKNVCAMLKGEEYAKDLFLRLHLPAYFNNSEHIYIDGAKLQVNEFGLLLDGEVGSPCFSSGVYTCDATVATDGAWSIQSLLALVPARFTESLSDINVDGLIQLEASAKGTYSDSIMPVLTAHLDIKEGKGAYKPLPYTVRDLQLDADARLDLNKQQPSTVTINKLSAKTKESRIAAKGKVEDLLEDMLIDLHLDIDANLPDFAYFMPKEMDLKGQTKGKANAKIRLSDLSEMRLEKGTIDADLTLTDIAYTMDSMEATLPYTKAKVFIPNKNPSRKSVNWACVDLDTKQVDFSMDTTINAALGASLIRIEVANVLNNEQDYFASIHTASLDGRFEDIHADLTNAELEAYLAGGKKMSAKIQTDALQAEMGEELMAKTEALRIEAAARYNSKEENLLLQWNPRLTIHLKNGEVRMPERLPEPVYIPSIEFAYSNKAMNIANSRIELGNSDLNIKGNVRHIGGWFRHKKILEGELDIVSDHCDANQLMAWFSAGEETSQESGAESQESKAESQEELTSTPEQNTPDSTKEMEPFMVPLDVDLALNTNLKEVEIFNQVAKDLKGGIFMQEGNLILDEVGFVCRAAKLQLTAMYRSPRRNHLYLGMDYHMVDVDIDELLTMIPNLEEMVPMLSSFKGAAEFHLAAETYLNSQYQPKMSTLRGAASLTGKDLVVLDGETFDKISKLLLFSKKTENKIDSINAELTIYKNQIDVYPLCVQMDNYMVALGGRHNTNMTFDYDINVLSPIYLGVKVSGSMDDLQIKLAKCKFAQDFKPHWYQKVDNQSRELRERIKQSMEKNVRIK
ncbi:MAG: AsmA-like C-terminal region-containing protein [Paludibacteraceae bacterium]|nr:AsmA-like C-terminal region-containing protein [Paludibacteraceae bacterium]MDD6748145.1 AsmA-like C-terminal region-containing protein [Paludibacteraceae bacterium]